VTTLPLFKAGPHSISRGKYPVGGKQQAGILAGTLKGKAHALALYQGFAASSIFSFPPNSLPNVLFLH